MRRALALAVVAVAALAVGFGALKAEDKQLKLGGPCPNFQALEGTDGKSYSLADFQNKDVLVICVTCNHCPYAVALEDRNVAFAKKYCGPDSKVGFIAVCVNKEDADTLPKLKERAKEKGFTFPYVSDPSQQLGRQLGAVRTPEYFVFDKNRKLVYHGALDDQQRTQQPGEVKDAYLVLAVEAALKGETPVKAETQATGCGIQYSSK